MTLTFFSLAEGLSESREAHDASLISLRSLGGKKKKIGAAQYLDCGEETPRV